MADIDVVSHVDISTHTSRVGCDLVIRHAVDVRNISTHTSRVGCDALGEAVASSDAISTHTSRVGCDGQQQTLRQHVNNFYSHIPCGMWRMGVYYGNIIN